MPTTWTSVTNTTATYVDAEATSNWDEHNWDEFNWDGAGATPTWTETTGSTTTWS